ncbi:hypothetical protein FHT82_000338 [Rhizobium sp. BK275]|uniref:hypothetical protein n=1 Tax=Rhizobium sp. BK275 TaxID=2587077 RepID=UPI00161D5255|nr:hypothetical protein [Rhizobium sp. BK275]MBB3387618.1 hypothetical protein [Rhizobium sp. BK275]
MGIDADLVATSHLGRVERQIGPSIDIIGMVSAHDTGDACRKTLAEAEVIGQRARLPDGNQHAIDDLRRLFGNRVRNNQNKLFAAGAAENRLSKP